MPNSEINTVEAAFREALLLDVSLGDRLKYVSNFIRSKNPEISNAVDKFVKRLAEVGVGNSAPQVGELMPDFMLPDQDGRFANLEEMRDEGPVILVFHRGHWCPYCRLAIRGYAAIQDSIAPFKLVGISPERQQFTQTLRKESEAKFPFLTDVGTGYALSLNLAIWVDDAMASIIENSGSDIPYYAGAKGWFLPIPAIFIVSREGVVIARHIDVDYRRRMEIEDIIDLLNRLRNAL